MRARTSAIVSLTMMLIVSSAIPAMADREVPIFNGKDFTGWTKRGGEAKYRVENGEVVGRSVPNTSNTFMATNQEFGDFTLELEFKIDDKDFNSGIQIRSHARPERRGERVYGYQVEIDPRPDRAWSAGIYYEGGKLKENYDGGRIRDEDWDRKAGWLDDLEDNEAARKAFKLGEWNKVRIEAKGRTIKTWINGVAAADFTDNDETAFVPSGFIALQVHSVGRDRDPKEVRWRNIKLTVPE